MEKRYCDNCGRRLANMNHSELCFACQPLEIPKYAEKGTMGSNTDRNAYMRHWRSKRKAAAI